MAVEGHFHGPVVRKIQHPPATVVEVRTSRAVAITCFGKIREITRSGVEILSDIGRIAKGKPPAEIHEQPLAPPRLGGAPFSPGRRQTACGRDQENAGGEDEGIEANAFHWGGLHFSAVNTL